MEVSGQLHARVALLREEELSVHIEQDVGPVRTLWSKETFLAHVSDRTPAIQHVACCYTG
jgi:hypothetical protein